MNLTGLRATRKAQSRRGWPTRVSEGERFEGDKDERYTPVRIVEWALHLAGERLVDLDVAACDEAHLAPRYFTRDTNGLKRAWDADVVWCNPPFTRPFEWTEHAWWNAERQHFRTLMMLLPAMRQEQPGWHRDIEPWRDRGQRRHGYTLDTHHYVGRAAFMAPGGVQLDSAGFPLVLLVFRRSTR